MSETKSNQAAPTLLVGVDFGLPHFDADLQELLFFGLLERGVYSASRGMMNLSLTVTDDQLATVLDALAETLQSLRNG